MKLITPIPASSLQLFLANFIVTACFHAINVHSSLSPTPLALLTAAVVLVTPCLIELPDETPFAFAFYAMVSLVIGLRMMDVATVDSATSKSWTSWDFYDFLFTFETRTSRIYNHDQLLKRAERGNVSAIRTLDLSIPVEKRTAAYYVDLIKNVLLKYALYHVGIYYLDAFPSDKNPPIGSLFNPLRSSLKTCVDHLVLCFTLCMMLDVVYSIMFHAIAEIFGAPYRHIMDSPFVSVSLRDFWSNRWNMMVKDNLHRVAFIPTIKLLHSISRQEKTRQDAKPPAWHVSVAAFMTFVFSAIMHEYMIFVLLSRSTTLENFWFFVIHGILTVGEGMLLKASRTIPELHAIVNRLPSWATWLMTTAAFMTLSPLFMNPYVREDFFVHHARFPTLL